MPKAPLRVPLAFDAAIRLAVKVKPPPKVQKPSKKKPGKRRK